jgi:hypothetical protein
MLHLMVVLNTLVQTTDQRSVHPSVQVPDHILSPHWTFARRRLRSVARTPKTALLLTDDLHAYIHGLRAAAKVTGSCQGHQTYTVAWA